MHSHNIVWPLVVVIVGNVALAVVLDMFMYDTPVPRLRSEIVQAYPVATVGSGMTGVQLVAPLVNVPAVIPPAVPPMVPHPVGVGDAPVALIPRTCTPFAFQMIG
jgi:hypothetical protein